MNGNPEYVEFPRSRTGLNAKNMLQRVEYHGGPLFKSMVCAALDHSKIREHKSRYDRALILHP